MKKSELIQKMIDITKENGFRGTITMDYLAYLEEKKVLVEIGDVDLK